MRLVKVLLSFATTTVIGGLLVWVPVGLLVMIPSVPAVLAGPLQYVRSERLCKLEVPLARVVQTLHGCGIGAGPLFSPDASAHSVAS